ncbi:MAG: 3D domain-containing protein [bacterium]
MKPNRIFAFLASLFPLILMMGLALLSTGCATTPHGGRYVVEKRMLTTGYCPCGECCSWHRNWLFRPVYSSGPLKGKRKDVGITASGVKARHGTIAADISRYPFGTEMIIDGYGKGRVEDQGGAITGDHIDLYFPTHREAMDWGKRIKVVKVWMDG